MRGLGGKLVFGLHQSTGVLLRVNVPQGDIVFHWAEQRDPGADEDGNASNNEALNEAGLKKPLNRDPTINVGMPKAPRVKPGNDRHRIP